MQPHSPARVLRTSDSRRPLPLRRLRVRYHLEVEHPAQSWRTPFGYRGMMLARPILQRTSLWRPRALPLVLCPSVRSKVNVPGLHPLAQQLVLFVGRHITVVQAFGGAMMDSFGRSRRFFVLWSYLLLSAKLCRLNGAHVVVPYDCDSIRSLLMRMRCSLQPEVRSTRDSRTVRNRQFLPSTTTSRVICCSCRAKPYHTRTMWCCFWFLGTGPSGCARERSARWCFSTPITARGVIRSFALKLVTWASCLSAWALYGQV